MKVPPFRELPLRESGILYWLDIFIAFYGIGMPYHGFILMHTAEKERLGRFGKILDFSGRLYILFTFAILFIVSSPITQQP